MTKLLVFGEILWDVFCSDSSEKEYKIGGAPYNFAAHATKLGAVASLVSAVGDDKLGTKALQYARNAGIDCSFISVNDLPTGYCEVTLGKGEPIYKLAKNVAYDKIQCPILNSTFDALVFGTLALRSKHNRLVLQEILKNEVFSDVFYDINIREDFCPTELIHNLLQYTTILKFSREEAGVFGGGTEWDLCERLSFKYPNLRFILLTLDSDGAVVYDCEQKTLHRSRKPQNALVSAVGAGDSFSACFLCNLKNGLPPEICLERAVTLSDFVVTKLEAVPEYPKGFLKKVI